MAITEGHLGGQPERRRSAVITYDLADFTTSIQNHLWCTAHGSSKQNSPLGASLRLTRMGILCGFRKPATRRLRRWPVKGFENWLIFYQARRDGVEIVHVMHGARDIESLLDA